jgi:hypothetical protein
MSGKRRFRGGGRRFIQLYTNVKRSQAYHDLDVYARAALFELLDRYNGINNGMIGLGCRELAAALKCSQSTAIRAFRSLDDSGLVQPLTGGTWRGKRATEWRLPFFRCNKTGELPKLNWEPRSEFATESAKGRVGKRKPSHSSPGEAQNQKTPMNVIPLSSRREAHIDIYQGVQRPLRDTDVAPWDDSTEGIGPLKPIVGPISPEVCCLLACELADNDPQTAWALMASFVGAATQRPEVAA